MFFGDSPIVSYERETNWSRGKGKYRAMSEIFSSEIYEEDGGEYTDDRRGGHRSGEDRGELGRGNIIAVLVREFY